LIFGTRNALFLPVAAIGRIILRGSRRDLRLRARLPPGSSATATVYIGPLADRRARIDAGRARVQALGISKALFLAEWKKTITTNIQVTFNCISLKSNV